ncbi:signal peptidase complex subunit 2-like [Raphidocelis subcapitata]|uniref:Signal peptidase complex subunit 2 n=1 Tax=Raphidocelis subcapitata TaxID=307507 RepID=A0A2V0PA28_9CHLO|nr:signal peptidase complex subunit 2-like [Raphidocelis subcapitata]|eukprot:GBF93955.1 signal peptidase complex subunit 2-like [Raphidocelis subcapitata]
MARAAAIKFKREQLEAEAPPPKPQKIDLNDAAAVKHKLDSTAAEVVLDAGYIEDHLISNVKIVLGAAAVLCAVYSHFGPGKFPDNWWTVATCVALYVAINAVLSAFSYARERDSFMVTQPKMGREHGIRLSSRMERYGDTYTLVIANADKYEDREVKLDTSVCSYFHSDGYLADSKFRGHVQKLLSQYERIDKAHEGSRPKALNPKKQR